MGSKTGVITFNALNRGRKHRGVDRNFDAAALAAIVNSGAVQERVKMRDMMGYYGHWPRVKFGMQVPEAEIVAGKQVNIEPAFVTTLLQADPDGTIRHEAEFLDTPSGRLAERLYKSKVGGFSSAITSKRAGERNMPIGFFGFDYVLEPNFTTNRGYSVQLDSVGEVEVDMLDEVGEYNAAIEGTMRLFDALQHDFDSVAQERNLALETIQRLQEENEQLMSMLATRDSKAEVTLDSVQPAFFGGGEHDINRRTSAFLSSKLVGFEKPKEPEEQQAGAEGRRLIDRMFHRG